MSAGPVPHRHAATREELAPPRVEEVAPGAYAYVQPDGSWALNNTGFLVGSDAVVAVDACYTEARTRAFREAIRGVTPEPVRTLVNTHHHADHTHGNCVMLPEATVVGHERAREEILATGFSVTALLPADVGELTLAPPVVTFSDRLDLWVGDQKAELVHVGPAHTTNDVYVWLPGRRVLYTGDLAFNGGTPFAVQGSVAGWIEALAVLRGLDAETVVPGHGDPCGPEVFDTIEAYLRFVQDAARAASDAGLSPLEAAREADLGPFADLLDPERLVGNLHRAYSELRGEPPGAALADWPGVFADMVAYNGGQPLRCFA